MLQPVEHPVQTLSAVLQPPNTFLVKEILAAQSPYRTQVDHVTSQLVIAGFVGKYIDLFMATAGDHLQFGRAANLAGESNAASTHHASIGEQARSDHPM
jgi:hypothetical protein